MICTYVYVYAPCICICTDVYVYVVVAGVCFRERDCCRRFHKCTNSRYCWRIFVALTNYKHSSETHSRRFTVVCVFCCWARDAMRRCRTNILTARRTHTHTQKKNYPRGRKNTAPVVWVCVCMRIGCVRVCFVCVSMVCMCVCWQTGEPKSDDDDVGGGDNNSDVDKRRRYERWNVRIATSWPLQIQPSQTATTTTTTATTEQCCRLAIWKLCLAFF